MAPALLPGDHVLMEGFSYLAGSPRRGDLLVFSTEGIDQIKPTGTFVMRVTGLPGEHIRFANSELLINGKPVVIKNEEGPISYPPLDEASARWATVDVHIPEGHYFVVGDNSGNSFDSRFWGTVAADKVLGRLCFRYWPPSRAGGVE